MLVPQISDVDIIVSRGGATFEVAKLPEGAMGSSSE